MPDIPFAMTLSEISYQIVGPVPIGATVAVSWTGVTVDHPCGSYGYAVILDAVGSSRPPESRFSLNQPTGAISFVTDQPASAVNVIVFTSNHCSTGTLFGVNVIVSGAPGFCQYGTQLRAGVAPILYLTQTAIQTVLLPTGATWLEQLFLGFLFQTVDLDALCGTGPPDIGVIDESTLASSAQTKFRILLAYLWAANCECRPGAPNPIPFPGPSATEPPGWPTAPTFDCDNVDPCAALVRIEQLLAAMSQTLSSDYQLATLQQRYSLPFATIRGAVHGGLVASGSFAIDRLIGVRIEIITLPEDKPQLVGNPPYIMNVGWVSVSDMDGMIEEKRITRSAMDWFPKLAPLSTLFGFSVQDGVTIRVTELEAEP